MPDVKDGLAVDEPVADAQLQIGAIRYDTFGDRLAWDGSYRLSRGFSPSDGVWSIRRGRSSGETRTTIVVWPRGRADEGGVRCETSDGMEWRLERHEAFDEVERRAIRLHLT